MNRGTAGARGDAWAGTDLAGEEGDLRHEALSAACGITDPALLGKLVALGLGGDTLEVLSMVPLVAVAWADGRLDAREREAVLLAASRSGIEGRGHGLLTRWLESPPAEEMIETWADYVRTTSADLAPDERLALRLSLLGRARRVAAAAGELLGHAPAVTPAEEAALARLARAFA